MWSLILPAITGIIDKLIPDPKAAAEAKLRIMEMQQAGELKQLDAAMQIIVAEAQGNWLQRSWRPIMMLTFTSLIVARWFGLSAPNLSEAEYTHLWNIVQLGIGGYVLGRSGEKIAETLATGKSNSKDKE